MENQRTECFSEKAVKGKYVIISVETFAQTRPLVWSSEKSYQFLTNHPFMIQKLL